MSSPSGGPSTQISPNPPPSAAPNERKRGRAGIACERCRRRKTRCSGSTPACKECSQGNHTCRYPPPDGGQTDNVIRDLQTAYDNTRRVLEALQFGGDKQSTDLLARLRATGDLEEVLLKYPDLLAIHNPEAWFIELGNGPPLPLSQANLARYPTGRPAQATTGSPMELPISLWSCSSEGDRASTNLLTLFWTWDYTLTRCIHRGTFLDDMCARQRLGQNRSGDGNVSSMFCSEFLVNAVLAVSSSFSYDPSQPEESQSRGRVFAEEAFKRFNEDRHTPSVPLLQGVAMLWVYEESLNNRHRAGELLNEFYRIHASLGIFDVQQVSSGIEGEQSNGRIQKAISAIAWGFYCLDAKISLIYNRPMRIRRPQHPLPLQNIEPVATGFDALDNVWSAYPSSNQTQNSYHREAFEAECRLVEVTESVLAQVELNRNCAVPDYVVSRDLYHRLLGWKDALPSILKQHRDPLPVTVFLQISFDMASVALLEPFTKVPFMFDGGHMASSMSCFHSDSMASTLWNYRTAFGMRHEYWMLQACWMSALISSSHLHPFSIQREPLRKACDLLYEMGGYFPLASELLTAVSNKTYSQGVEVFRIENMPTPFHRAGKAGAVKFQNRRVFDEDGDGQI